MLHAFPRRAFRCFGSVAPLVPGGFSACTQHWKKAGRDPRQTCPTTSQDGKSRWVPKNLRQGGKDLTEGHPQKCTMTRTWRKAGNASGRANEGKSNQMRSDPPGTGPRNQVLDTHPALRAGHSFSSCKPSDCADWIPGPARRPRDGSSQTLPAPTLYSEEDARYGGFS